MKEFTTDFIPVPFMAIKDKKLTPASRLILGIIYYITEKRGEKFFMSNKYIANILDMNAGSINNSLFLLEENGYIKREYNADNTKRLEIKCFIKITKGTSTDVGGTLNDVGGTSTDAQNKIPNKILELELCEFEKIKERFDSIRTKHKRILKGKARGLETEWSNFIKKNPKPTLSLIETMTLGAKNYYKSESKKPEADNPFRYTQNFSTWINQKSWEMYLPDNNK